MADSICIFLWIILPSAWSMCVWNHTLVFFGRAAFCCWWMLEEIWGTVAERICALREESCIVIMRSLFTVQREAHNGTELSYQADTRRLLGVKSVSSCRPQSDVKYVSISVITPLQTVISDTVVVSNWICCECVARSQNILLKCTNNEIRLLIPSHPDTVQRWYVGGVS